MSGTSRYGCKWPDGSETGPITDRYRRAAAYAKQHEGKVFDYELGREASGAASEEEPPCDTSSSLI